MRHTLWLWILCVLLAGCSGDGSGSPSAAAPVPSTTTPTPSTTATTSTRTTTTPPKTTTRPTAKAKPKPAPKPSVRTSLTGDRRNAFAFAPLGNPSAVTIEGSVPSSRAWSTSKVLVISAFLDTVVDGDPAKLTSSQRSLVRRALTASDGDAVVALRGQIPGRPGAAINRVLRSIGDTRTSAPDTSQGLMQWSVREQVRFMAALSSGKVVSPAASAYLLGAMHPISAHRWGLGTIGAGPFKGGWLRSTTETRQMGIVDGYAVAIITDHVGPAVLQTDGDSAHVQQMNYLAAVLKARLAKESGRS